MEGRIIFYVLQVILYFFVFTKPHVLKMKTGDFGYNKKDDRPGLEKGVEES